TATAGERAGVSAFINDARLSQMNAGSGRIGSPAPNAGERAGVPAFRNDGRLSRMNAGSGRIGSPAGNAGERAGVPAFMSDERSLRMNAGMGLTGPGHVDSGPAPATKGPSGHVLRRTIPGQALAAPLAHSVGP